MRVEESPEPEKPKKVIKKKPPPPVVVPEQPDPRRLVEVESPRQEDPEQPYDLEPDNALDENTKQFNEAPPV